MKFFFGALSYSLCAFLGAGALEQEPFDTITWEDTGSSLFRDLQLVEKINKKINDKLPFFYNYSMVGGYFNMPSARMGNVGDLAVGYAYVPPYRIYGTNFQVMERIELVANYRIMHGNTELNFGNEGFGDDAERIGNAKLALLAPEDGYGRLPLIAIGAEDFIGTRRFNYKYIVVTQELLDANLEWSIGWGKGRIKGFFGGLAWTPFRNTENPLFKHLTLMAEYDAINYKKHHHEHNDGREVKSRINVGFSLIAWNALQVSLSSLRGEEIAASASLRYPLGSTKGFFPKIDDPLNYRSPVDTEPLDGLRVEKEFAQQLAYAFSEQGLDLFSLYVVYDEEGRKNLWMKVVDNRYRQESVVRERIQHLLASLTPADIHLVTVVIEADAIPSHAYRFRTQDLFYYREGLASAFELKTLSPKIEAPFVPDEYESSRLFIRRKKIWTFTARPRLITFFGSAQGKFKYNIAAVAVPEGYLLEEIYYKFQFAYQIKSSMMNLGDVDRINPSQLLTVRSDSIRYFQTNTVAMEQAFLQRSWNLGKGFFYRAAGGYFEPAYGGVAMESLYYPVDSCWGIGLEAATVLKRRYKGLGFTTKVRRLHGTVPHYVGYVGLQYFLDLYYEFKPLSLNFKISIGEFLARDKGIKTEVSRYFPSGAYFGLWFTYTNAHDKVNGHTYYDKGFFFSIPLDMFLRQSSRNYVGYAMSAWLRDCGAQAETGKRLYPTLYEERHY
jgi:hypothetical protein